MSYGPGIYWEGRYRHTRWTHGDGWAYANGPSGWVDPNPFPKLRPWPLSAVARWADSLWRC
jgi:hypothetical protein